MPRAWLEAGPTAVVLKVCAWTALVVALVLPVVVLLLRGLSDAASVAQLVSLPLATVSLILALPIWSRRTGSPTDNQVSITTTDADHGQQAKVAGRKPWLVILMVMALLIAGAGIGTFALYASGAFSTEILAEPVQVPGENPFTPPVGNDQPNVEPPLNVGRTFPGSTSGLYGGTLNNSSCDPQAMGLSDRETTNQPARTAGGRLHRQPAPPGRPVLAHPDHDHPASHDRDQRVHRREPDHQCGHLSPCRH